MNSKGKKIIKGRGLTQRERKLSRGGDSLKGKGNNKGEGSNRGEWEHSQFLCVIGYLDREKTEGYSKRHRGVN